MIKTLIFDDDVAATVHLTELLATFDDLEVASAIQSGQTALKMLRQKSVDLIFLGAELSEMTGFDFLEKLEPPHLPLIIYMSTDERDALKAFEYRVSDFLLKPIAYERIEKAVKHAKESLGVGGERSAHTAGYGISPLFNGKEKEIMPIKVSGNIYFVEPKTIRYITAAGYYIEIFMKDKKLLVRETMESILERLPDEDFVRIHRSHIINAGFLDAINTIGPGEAEALMKDGKMFRISKTYKTALLKKMGL